MSELEDAKETYSDLKESYKEQKKRSKEEDVELPDVTEIDKAMLAVKSALDGDSFDEDTFGDLASEAEDLIDELESAIDDLCEDDEMDPETHARLLALQKSTDEGMAGSLADLLASADPTLIAPFEGVDVPGWGMAAALITSAGADEKSQAEALATISMDMGKYNRVQDHFTARMQGDTSFQLTMIYSKAFTEAQEKIANQQDGSSSNDSSVPFEKYAEISAAMSAWSQSGEDVNALLQSEFGYTAASWSTVQMKWSKELKDNLPLFNKFNELEVKYKAKYESSDQDDDLNF